MRHAQPLRAAASESKVAGLVFPPGGKSMKLRALRVALAMLVALLVAAPLAASLWHHHAGSSDTNCPVCHFNHQPMDRPAEGLWCSSIQVITYRSTPSKAQFIASSDILPLPSRAPPVA